MLTVIALVERPAPNPEVRRQVDDRDVHEAAAATRGSTRSDQRASDSRTAPIRPVASRRALCAGKPRLPVMYTCPTSLSVAGPVIAVMGSPNSRRISSAAPQQATGSGAAMT